VGGPFLVYIAASRRFFMLWRAAAAAAALLCVYELLRTGSRGGLITVIVLGLICFITGSARLKLGIVVAASALACVAAAVIPAVTWTRLGTVFSQSSGDTTGAASSAYARRALLLQSIAITFEHPLFGVGPGVYAAAAADRAKEIGEHTNWQVTHNASTELSAESGIPGLILFLMTLASILGSALAMRRRCRRTPGHEDEAILAGCIVLSAVAFCINCIFASIGTDFYLYMVGGFAVAAARLNMRAAAEPAPEPAPAVRTFPEPFPAPQPEEAAVRSGSALERRLAQRKLEQAR
jgi:O-antigen ligase